MVLRTCAALTLGEGEVDPEELPVVAELSGRGLGYCANAPGNSGVCPPEVVWVDVGCEDDERSGELNSAALGLQLQGCVVDQLQEELARHLGEVPVVADNNPLTVVSICPQRAVAAGELTPPEGLWPEKFGQGGLALACIPHQKDAVSLGEAFMLVERREEFEAVGCPHECDGVLYGQDRQVAFDFNKSVNSSTEIGSSSLSLSLLCDTSVGVRVESHCSGLQLLTIVSSLLAGSASRLPVNTPDKIGSGVLESAESRRRSQFHVTLEVKCVVVKSGLTNFRLKYVVRGSESAKMLPHFTRTISDHVAVVEGSLQPGSETPVLNACLASWS